MEIPTQQWDGRRRSSAVSGGIRLLMVGALLLGFAAAGNGAEMPRVKSANGVVFVSGGIGEAEQAQLAARESEFNLKLVFSLVQGNFVADASVAITDAKGAIQVEHLSEGPIFMARLPAGHYGLVATYEGKAVIRKVRVVAGRLRTEYLRWPADPLNDHPVSRWLDKD